MILHWFNRVFKVIVTMSFTTFLLFQQIVGSDIAELLLHGSNSGGDLESDARTLIDFSDSQTVDAAPCSGDDLLTGTGAESSEKALQSYTQLLLAGRKKVSMHDLMTRIHDSCRSPATDVAVCSPTFCRVLRRPWSRL